MRYVFGVLGIILVALLAILLINSSPSKKTSTTKSATNQLLKLPDYASRNSQVSEITQGRIVGQDQFRAIRITVGANNRTIDIIQGYDGNVLRSESLTNTRNAYDNFLRALDNSGFTRTKPSTFADERGVCPLGNRFIYNLQDDGKQVIHTWSVSCNSVGTFAGSSSTVRLLFQNQISDYNTFTQDVRL